jgi:hypothetical protein
MQRSRYTRDMLAQKQDYENTKEESSHMQTNYMGLGRNKTCQCLDLGLPASKTVRNKCLLFNSVGSLLKWQVKGTTLPHHHLEF